MLADFNFGDFDGLDGEGEVESDDFALLLLFGTAALFVDFALFAGAGDFGAFAAVALSAEVPLLLLFGTAALFVDFALFAGAGDFGAFAAVALFEDLPDLAAAGRRGGDGGCVALLASFALLAPAAASSSVSGASVVGASVVGASVAGARVVGARVIGAWVAGASVESGAAWVVGASVGSGGVAVLDVARPLDNFGDLELFLTSFAALPAVVKAANSGSSFFGALGSFAVFAEALADFALFAASRTGGGVAKTEVSSEATTRSSVKE